MSTNLFTDETKSFSMNPSPTSRPVGKKLQARIYDVPGYVIDDDATILPFRFNGIDYVGTLAAGFYTNVSTLLDAVIASMALISGGSFSHNQSETAPWYPLIAIYGSSTLAFRFISTSLPAASKYSLRKIGALLGYDTSVNVSPGTGAGSVPRPLVAKAAVPFKRSASLEYGNISLDIIAQRRRAL